jgi:anti-sigma regulatory factor (Ser/Thr protein kinase)
LPTRSSLDIPYSEAALAGVGPFVEQFAAGAGLRAQVSYALQLCLEEATANAVRHGAPAGGGSLPPVLLELRAEAGRVVATIRDHGLAFDPLRAPAPVSPATVADAVPGGLGIHLMRQFCRDIAYEREGDTNLLTLSFPA